MSAQSSSEMRPFYGRRRRSPAQARQVAPRGTFWPVTYQTRPQGRSAWCRWPSKKECRSPAWLHWIACRTWSCDRPRAVHAESVYRLQAAARRWSDAHLDAQGADAMRETAGQQGGRAGSRGPRKLRRASDGSVSARTDSEILPTKETRRARARCYQRRF